MLNVHAAYHKQCGDIVGGVDYLINELLGGAAINERAVVSITDLYPAAGSAAVTVTDWTGVTIATGTTDSSGDWTVALPGPGQYLVTTSKTPFVTDTTWITVGPGTLVNGQLVCDTLNVTVVLKQPAGQMYIETAGGPFTAAPPNSMNLTDPGGTVNLPRITPGAGANGAELYLACIDGSGVTRNLNCGGGSGLPGNETSPSYHYYYYLVVLVGGQSLLYIRRRPTAQSTLFIDCGDVNAPEVAIVSCANNSTVGTNPLQVTGGTCDNYSAGLCDCLGNGDGTGSGDPEALNPLPDGFTARTNNVSGPPLDIEFDTVRGYPMGGYFTGSYYVPPYCGVIAALNFMYPSHHYSEGQCPTITATAGP